MATVVGAGLAGCEAAWQLAERGIDVTLYEMRPGRRSPAHETDKFAELVCSNSFRGDRPENAVGLLKAEMRLYGSLIMECADATRVEAGGALAVDRAAFSGLVTERVNAHPRIRVLRSEIENVPDSGDGVIIAAGPLCAERLSEDIRRRLGGKSLFFFDASAPLVDYESLDMERAYFGSRYGRGNDYINCPLEKEEYLAFQSELASAECACLHGFEDKRVFEGCLPVEVLARRGEDALRYGPLKPVGLRNPRDGKGAYAVLQLRRDNAAGSVYNMVGFQTHLLFGEQKRVFSMIPALRNAIYLRYGVMHRNTYIDSPRLLNGDFSVRTEPGLYFAGQISGVEGYAESAASGFIAGLSLACRKKSLPVPLFPAETAMGALSTYVSNENVADFQPMNINFGLLPPLADKKLRKTERYAALAARALTAASGVIESGMLGGKYENHR